MVAKVVGTRSAGQTRSQGEKLLDRRRRAKKGGLLPRAPPALPTLQEV